MELVTVISALAAAAYAVHTVRRSTRPRPPATPRDASWAQVAREHGGRYDNGAIHVDDDGAHVVVEPWDEGTRDKPRWVTRAWARFVSGSGPHFVITPEDLFTRANKIFGHHDAVLDRWPPFDHAFYVETPSAALMKEAWPPELMRTALERVRPCKVESDGEHVTVSVEGWVATRDRLDACIELAGALARADVFGARALRRLPGATGLAPTARWSLDALPEVVVALPQRVRVGTCIARDRVCSYVATEAPRSAESFTVTVPKYGAPTHTGGALPGFTVRELARLGPGELRCADGELRFCWASLQHAPGRLLAGARLLARGAATSRGPFR